MKKQIKPMLTLYLLLWFGINLLFLTSYPFMHTDESWLSGLSRNMIEEGRLDVTESFYDLHERHPHGIKVIFHLFQSGFIKLLGYSLFSVRLLSLTNGLISLILLFYILRRIIPTENPDLPALFFVFLMSWDIQFIYASHFARQEICLVSLMLASLLSVIYRKDMFGGIMAGFFIGISIGFHPNAFIIAWPVGLFILSEIIFKKRRLLSGIAFLALILMGAVLFVFISFKYNPHFLRDYLHYGAPLGVVDAPDVKVLKAPLFFKNLFNQRGGTYYLPPIRLQLITFPLILILLRKEKILAFTTVIGLCLGLMILGKFSQPSIVFFTPLYYITGSLLITEKQGMTQKIILIIFIILMAVAILQSWGEIKNESPTSKENYSDYLAEISRYVPEDSVVLGSLTLEYYLENGHLYHWRNLAELSGASEISLREYIRNRNIEYIVIPEEISYIYSTRPKWNVLYGNTAFWYPELTRFIEEECNFVGEFNSPGYGMRIAAYRYSRDWSVKIYRVRSEDSK